MRVNFDGLALDERRMILVASDTKYEEIINELDWASVLLTACAPVALIAGGIVGAAGLASALFGSAATASTYLGSTFAAMNLLANKKQEEERSWFKKAFTKGEIPLPHLSPAEAGRRFRFDLGGPEDGAVYLANPCVSNHYLPPATANERLAQEKLAAFMQIASALGAKKIEVKSGESVKADAKAEADVPLPDAAAQVGLGVSFRSSTSFDRQAVAEYGKPTKAPHVPNEFTGWLDMEPTLRGMARMRLEGEPTKVGVNLQFGSTVDVGADLTAKFAGRGLKVGGSYRKVASSRWSFDVEFWPKS